MSQDKPFHNRITPKSKRPSNEQMLADLMADAVNLVSSDYGDYILQESFTLPKEQNAPYSLVQVATAVHNFANTPENMAYVLDHDACIAKLQGMEERKRLLDCVTDLKGKLSAFHSSMKKSAAATKLDETDELVLDIGIAHPDYIEVAGKRKILATSYFLDSVDRLLDRLERAIQKEPQAGENFVITFPGIDQDKLPEHPRILNDTAGGIQLVGLYGLLLGNFQEEPINAIGNTFGATRKKEMEGAFGSILQAFDTCERTPSMNLDIIDKAVQDHYPVIQKAFDEFRQHHGIADGTILPKENEHKYWIESASDQMEILEHNFNGLIESRKRGLE